MWIKKAEYDALKDQIADLREQSARSTTLADVYRVRVNELTHENATLKATITGQPQLAPTFERIAGAGIGRPNSTGGVLMNEPLPDYAHAVLDFDDMGDSEADRLGVHYDPNSGEVKYRNQ